MAVVNVQPPPIQGSEPLSLYHLLRPEVLADPYPLYKRLRDTDPVHWDPFLHAWVVTSYDGVVKVLRDCSAARAFTPDQLTAMGLSEIRPIAEVMVLQMLFLDPPDHTRLRALASQAFTAARVRALRSHIEEIAESLMDDLAGSDEVDIISDFAGPLPALVTAELLGLPASDHRKLKSWSADFAEMLGNFQHNPNRLNHVLRTVKEMNEYFRKAIHELRENPREGLIHSFMTAEAEGQRFTEDEIVANTIITMVGGQETTTNLIGNGVLTLMRHPAALNQLRGNPSLIPSAVEELLRFESPSQHTARIAPHEFELGGKPIRGKEAVIAVMAAANRDPDRFQDPDVLDLARADNRHVAFGWGSHFCFGAPLARIEGQVALDTLLRRVPEWMPVDENPASWRMNLGLRGLESLKVRLTPEADGPAIRGRRLADGDLGR